MTIEIRRHRLDLRPEAGAIRLGPFECLELIGIATHQECLIPGQDQQDGLIWCEFYDMSALTPDAFGLDASNPEGRTFDVEPYQRICEFRREIQIQYVHLGAHGGRLRALGPGP